MSARNRKLNVQLAVRSPRSSSVPAACGVRLGGVENFFDLRNCVVMACSSSLKGSDLDNITQFQKIRSRMSVSVEEHLPFWLDLIAAVGSPLLLSYIQAKARWRMRQGVADRLRPRGHHHGVGPVLLVERVKRVERRAFLLG